MLTFDARPDYPDVEAGLRERGELVDGVGLLNLYDWLRDNPLPGGSLDLERDRFEPLDPRGRVPGRRNATAASSPARASRTTASRSCSATTTGSTAACC